MKVQKYLLAAVMLNKCTRMSITGTPLSRKEDEKLHTLKYHKTNVHN